jgi:uncharacterized metal-binding protein YceD (DUF177 family)
MLILDISEIPPEGVDVDEALDAAGVHLLGEEDFVLRPGGALRCHVEKVDGDTVHVRGRLEAPLGLECGRCLEAYPLVLSQELDLFYLPHRPGQEEEEEDEVELDDHEMVVAYYEGDRLDLGEVVREQFFLSVPLKPLCRDDCRGRCPSCGKNRNAESCGCPAPEEVGDPRLAALKKLFDDETH